MTPKRYWILIEVECCGGEENIAIDTISPEEVDLITPVLLKIQQNKGWYPTGLYSPTVGSSIIDEYGGFDGWETLERYLPRPQSGIERISRALLWEETPMSLYMK